MLVKSYFFKVSSLYVVICSVFAVFKLQAQNNEDAGKFITEWVVEASDPTITIPTYDEEEYNYTVEWGDQQVNSGVTGSITHTYDLGGRDRLEVSVKISGDFPRIYFNNVNDGNKEKLTSILQWGDIAWSSMKRAFYGCENLMLWANDAPILTGVTSLDAMFQNCESLHPIDQSPNPIDLDLNDWNVSSISSMQSVFEGCTNFNGAIGTWVTSNVITFYKMFKDASSFNMDISNWSTSKALEMDDMFNGASAFDQAIGGWDLSKLVTASNMLYGVTLSIVNYDSLLIGWATDTSDSQDDEVDDVPSGITIDAQGNYCIGADAKDTLENLSWSFPNIGTELCTEAFITTWTVEGDATAITIPTKSGNTYNYTVDWGDGTASMGHTEDATHIYTSANTYTVTITGDFPRIYFNHGGDRTKIVDINQWGTRAWSSMERAFYGCTGLTELTATDQPNLENVTNMSYMFARATSFNQAIGGWNTANVTNMKFMFYEATSFNQAIGGWNTANVTNMESMFYGATSFNQAIGGWNTANVTNMESMFTVATQFNKAIGAWDTSKVTSMNSMFYGATSFNQAIGDWDTANVIDMESMFSGATQFNKAIGGWNTSKVVFLAGIFYGAETFDQNIGAWDLSSIDDMSDMFEGAGGLSSSNYESTLEGWATDTSSGEGDGVDDVPIGIHLEGGGSEYCNNSARTTLINDFEWRFTDGGRDINCTTGAPFISTWQTSSTDEEVNIMMHGREDVYDFMVDWGDGTKIGYAAINDVGFKILTHTYSDAGSHTVHIYGVFPDIKMNNNSHSKDKLLSVDQWGDIAWESMHQAFYGCSNLRIFATDQPNLASVTNMNHMFRDCSNVGNNDNAASLGEWDVSSIENMNSVFRNASSFDEDLSGWDIGNVENNMYDMFFGVTLSTEHYNSLLAGWATDSYPNVMGVDDIPTGVSFHGGNSKYCDEGAEAKVTLINEFSWNFMEDGGPDTTDICGTLTNNVAFDNLLDYQVIPNPATTGFTVVGGENQQPMTIEVYNSLGAMMLRNEAYTGQRIDVSNLAEGLYFVKIMDMNTSSILEFIKKY